MVLAKVVKPIPKLPKTKRIVPQINAKKGRKYCKMELVRTARNMRKLKEAVKYAVPIIVKHYKNLSQMVHANSVQSTQKLQ